MDSARKGEREIENDDLNNHKQIISTDHTNTHSISKGENECFRLWFAILFMKSFFRKVLNFDPFTIHILYTFSKVLNVKL